jgi:hypothetical protein
LCVFCRFSFFLKVLDPQLFPHPWISASFCCSAAGGGASKTGGPAMVICPPGQQQHHAASILRTTLFKIWNVNG